MHFQSSILLLLPLSFSLSSAYPQPFKDRRDYQNIWSVTDYDYGCSPGGCEYSFNISAPAINGSAAASGFTTSCSGPISEDDENYGAEYVVCTDSSVIWKLDIGETYDELYVSHVWTVNGSSGTSCTYNVTGTQALSEDQTGSFDIVDIVQTAIC